MSIVNIIPETVPYYVWDSILKIKYYPKDEALKSIWTEEYVNNIEHYDESDMVCILKQIIDAVYSEKQKANLFERFINNSFGRWDSKDITSENICKFFYEEIQLLKVRGSKSKELNSPTFDLYQIKKGDKIYTIKEYDELKAQQLGDTQGEIKMTKQEATNDNLELKYLESQIALCTMVRQFMHTYRKEDGTPYFYTAYQTAGEWAFSVLNFTDAFVSFEEFYTKYDELCTKLSELNGLPKSSVSRLELYHEEERNGKIVCDNEREWD